MVGKSESAGAAKPAGKAKAAGDKPAPKKAAGDKPAPKKAAPKASTARAAATKAAALKTASGPRVKITQVGSPIGRKSDQRATLRALGLNRINRSREIDDTPSIRGMLRKVGHLLRIESVS